MRELRKFVPGAVLAHAVVKQGDQASVETVADSYTRNMAGYGLLTGIWQGASLIIVGTLVLAASVLAKKEDDSVTPTVPESPDSDDEKTINPSPVMTGTIGFGLIASGIVYIVYRRWWFKVNRSDLSLARRGQLRAKANMYLSNVAGSLMIITGLSILAFYTPKDPKKKQDDEQQQDDVTRPFAFGLVALGCAVVVFGLVWNRVAQKSDLIAKGTAVFAVGA